MVETAAPLVPFAPQLAAADPLQLMIPQLLASAAEPVLGQLGGGPQQITPDQARSLLESITAAASGGGLLDSRRYSGLFGLKQALESDRFSQAALIKTQIAGPITAAGVFNCDKVNLGTDYSFIDEMSRLVAKTAEAQIKLLRSGSDLPVTIWIDEPLLETFAGRSDQYLRRAGLDLLASLIIELRSAGAFVGLHCCSFPPLAAYSTIKPDILSFDAWNGLEKMFDGRSERELIESDIVFALGIVPTGPELDAVTSDDLKSKLERTIFNRYDKNTLQSRIILTPACGLALNSPQQSERAFALLGQLRHSLLN